MPSSKPQTVAEYIEAAPAEAHEKLHEIRHAEGSPRFLIVLNMSHRPCYFKPQHEIFTGKVIAATIPELEEMRIDGDINLSGDEGIIIKLDN